MDTTPIVSLDALTKQLEASEKELEAAKAYLYRLDGAIQLLKQLIATSQAPAPNSDAHL